MLRRLQTLLKRQWDDKKVSIAMLEPHLHPAIESIRYGFTHKMGEYAVDKDAFFNLHNGLGHPERMKAGVEDAVFSNRDLILAHGANFAKLAQEASQSVYNPAPIVFTNVTDPIDVKLATSLEEPGGISTGLLTHESRYKERLENMCNIFTGLQHVFVVYNPEEACGTLGVHFLKLHDFLSQRNIKISAFEFIRNESLNDALISRLKFEKPDVLFLMYDDMAMGNLEKIADIASSCSIPVFTSDGESVAMGEATFSCGNDGIEVGRRLGEHVYTIVYSGVDLGTTPLAHYYKKYCTRYSNAQIARLGLQLSDQGWNWLKQHAESV